MLALGFARVSLRIGNDRGRNEGVPSTLSFQRKDASCTSTAHVTAREGVLLLGRLSEKVMLFAGRINGRHSVTSRPPAPADAGRRHRTTAARSRYAGARCQPKHP